MERNEQNAAVQRDENLSEADLAAVGGGRKSGASSEGAGRMIQCAKCKTYYSDLEHACPKCGSLKPRGIW